jgi:hypothetical protein
MASNVLVTIWQDRAQKSGRTKKWSAETGNRRRFFDSKPSKTFILFFWGASFKVQSNEPAHAKAREGYKQGDQIGRFFSQRVFVYFVQFF